MESPARYERNLRGYGGKPPHPRWPGEAVVAVQFVVNYEEGGENCILHGDAASEAFLSEIPGAAQWPGERHWNMESIYEYGARAGFWRLLRVFSEAGIPATVFGVATALERSPEQVAAMQEAGWEIASHGYKWIDYKDIDPETERRHLRDAIRIHGEVTGERPRGFYLGRASAATIRIAAEEGFDYLSDSYADDLPYWHEHGNGAELVIPYALDSNDMRFATTQGFSSGDQFLAYLKDAFDFLHAEGRDGHPKMLSVGLHCRLAGRPGRTLALRRFIEYVLSHERVWIPRRIEIAEHWRAHHPYRPSPRRPSAMSRSAFVEAFGGVFEHSPWIAERTYERELGPAHDSAAGLHSAMARVFRSAGETERLKVLRAHPDLAGRLARARRLTKESAAEQASAGLDALTDAERAEFERLNAAYSQRFGFPFIIAVRGLDKARIFMAFRQRLGNEKSVEFATACSEVERIALLRLEELLAGGPEIDSRPVGRIPN